MNHRGQTKKGRNQKVTIRWAVAGFISVILLAGVFYSGTQFGNGKWQFSLMKPVTANRSLPNRLDYSSVNEVYQALKQKYDGKLDEQKLTDGMKKGLVEAAGDPYTTFMDGAQAKSFNEQLSGSFSGIGAELGKQGSDIVIISPIAGFPAEKAGLKTKDVIIAIDDQDATGLNVDEAVKRIRGEKGTSVKLTVIRGGQDKLNFTIVRDTITIPSVTSKILDGNIGYISISRFSDDTSGLVTTATNDFKAKNVKGVILDVRGNPGGYLTAAVNVSSIWLKNGQTILDEKRDDKVIQSFKATTDGALVGMPTVVLINEGSASASEITAGALKDNNAATIIGVTSYGKGSVQEFSTISGGGMLKVTVARWYTPAGKNIDKEGIEPTAKVELSDADAKAANDTQLNAAKAQLVK